ncbi:hypothetical protein ACFV9C_23740 [Kribbella sp. NPDC059898]|uniref:hypothetical protein n=1 Tax=Kribbella sp. NPDC059898 TaxID=3346995 RepID=UPI0036568B73
MPNIIVLSPEPGTFTIDRARFEEAVVQRFGQQTKIISESADDQSSIDVTARVSRPGEPWFQIFHFGTGDAISTDGTNEQAVEVMLWVRSLLPDEHDGPVWAIDEAYTGHVELIPGMTPDDVRSGWLDHDEHPPE